MQIEVKQAARIEQKNQPSSFSGKTSLDGFAMKHEEGLCYPNYKQALD